MGHGPSRCGRVNCARLSRGLWPIRGVVAAAVFPTVNEEHFYARGLGGAAGGLQPGKQRDHRRAKTLPSLGWAASPPVPSGSRGAPCLLSGILPRARGHPGLPGSRGVRCGCWTPGPRRPLDQLSLSLPTLPWRSSYCPRGHRPASLVSFLDWALCHLHPVGSPLPRRSAGPLAAFTPGTLPCPAVNAGPNSCFEHA